MGTGDMPQFLVQQFFLGKRYNKRSKELSIYKQWSAYSDILHLLVQRFAQGQNKSGRNFRIVAYAPFFS